MPGAKNWGTGFYINLGSSKYSIILTAGHNLINEKRLLVTDLKILRASPESSIIISESMVKICEKFKADPSKKNRVNDYGAILLPLDSNQPGFGFSMKLGLLDEISSSIYITGHTPQSDQESPVAMTNSGNIKMVRQDYIRYNIKTITGNSGGPVWVAHRGCETVIGIQ